MTAATKRPRTTRRVPDHDQTLAELNAIADPKLRLARAAEIARTADAARDRAKDTRNVAAAFLYNHRGWKDRKGEVAKLAQMDRWTLNNILDDQPAAAKVDPGEVDWDKLDREGRLDDLLKLHRSLISKTEPQVVRFVEKHGAEYRLQDAIHRTAARVRDAVAYGLMTGEFGEAVQNADVCRIARMKTSWASNIRKGRKFVK